MRASVPRQENINTHVLGFVCTYTERSTFLRFSIHLMTQRVINVPGRDDSGREHFYRESWRRNAYSRGASRTRYSALRAAISLGLAAAVGAPTFDSEVAAGAPTFVAPLGPRRAVSFGSATAGASSSDSAVGCARRSGSVSVGSAWTASPPSSRILPSSASGESREVASNLTRLRAVVVPNAPARLGASNDRLPTVLRMSSPHISTLRTANARRRILTRTPPDDGTSLSDTTTPDLVDDYDSDADGPPRSSRTSTVTPKTATTTSRLLTPRILPRPRRRRRWTCPARPEHRQRRRKSDDNVATANAPTTTSSSLPTTADASSPAASLAPSVPVTAAPPRNPPGNAAATNPSSPRPSSASYATPSSPPRLLASSPARTKDRLRVARRAVLLVRARLEQWARLARNGSPHLRRGKSRGT